ncbi:hypothetical protein [Arthrobacter sp. B0490]|uniref:acyltransferase n=1 Tax=Arthrobacter sp. B0490 TaxID=2058891 RepID=UPI000CE5045E
MKLWNRLASIADERVLRHLPGKASMRLRLAILRSRGAKISRNVVLGTGARVIHPAGLEVGARASIARDVVLDARGTLVIHEGALIGFESVLLSSTHNSGDSSRPVHDQGMYSASVAIGPNTWLGTRCVVMPGVTIGAAVVVASAAVVTKDLSAGQVYGGVPAKWIRVR